MYTKPEQPCSVPLVAEVVVGAPGEPRWNTVDGKRPPITSEREIVSNGYLVYTSIVFASFTPLRQHSLKSDLTATLVTIGGQAREDTYQVMGYRLRQALENTISSSSPLPATSKEAPRATFYSSPTCARLTPAAR